jgi:anaerobic ribonucleoside-triphosphate reductase activating protein
MRVAGLINDSIVDGPGLRFAVFFQGCEHGCEGCQNPETHDLNGGTQTTKEEILKQIDKNPLLGGVTFTGGEPFLQAAAIVPLAAEVKRRGLNLIIYTGFTLEEVLEDEEMTELLKYADTLVDGKFVLEEKTYDIPFVGSRNQRVFDLQTTRVF